MADAAVLPVACPWHRDALRALLARAHLPHALLFTGEAGTGKRRFADALAARLLCQSPAGDEACGRCKACLLLAAGTHPDLLVVEPEAQRAQAVEEEDGEGGRRKRKPSREIRVDDIRALTAFAVRTAQYGRGKVIVLEPADAMNTNAANALLKTLEEPVPGVLLLLVSSSPALLAATVRSRCQPVRLPAPDPAAACAWLAAQGAQDPAGLLAAAGSPLRALAVLAEDDDWPAQRRRLARALVGALRGEQPVVAVAAQIAEAPEARWLDWLPLFIADAVRLAQAGQAARLRNPDLRAELAALVESRPTQPLFLLGDDLARLRQQLLASAGLARPLLWEEWLLRWSVRTPGR